MKIDRYCQRTSPPAPLLGGEGSFLKSTFYCVVLGILKKIVYKTGTTIKVRTVATSKPNIMVTAMDLKNAS
jgi:hypothetical protein